MFEFDNNTTRFSLLNAFRLAEASEFVYNLSWDEVEKKIIQGWGFTNFKPFEKNDISLVDLIRMKKAAGRERDKIDIKALIFIKGLKND